MNPFDIFFKKYSYKFPKGYPDMNNEQDILLLESILLNEFGINLNEVESPNSLQAKNILKKEFDLNDNNFVDMSSNSFKVLVSGNERMDFIQKVSDLDDFEHELKGSSSIGRLIYQPENAKKPVIILVKPESAQGLGSAGKLNEYNFNKLINSAIEQNGKPITVILKSSKKTIKIPDVFKAKDSSTNGAKEFTKSDSQLLNQSGKVLANISLKKLNAIRWESSKTRLIDGVNIFKSFINKVGKIGTNDETGLFDNVVLYPLNKEGKYKLYNPKTEKILSKVIITNIPDKVENEVIFGNDSPKTIVVKETFEGGYKDYTFNDETLILHCHIIYTDLEDIKDTQDEPVFALSNHIGQSYGIEFRSFSKGALYSDENNLKGSSTEIDFNSLK
jgi:hypothetical protein